MLRLITSFSYIDITVYEFISVFFPNDPGHWTTDVITPVLVSRPLVRDINPGNH